jgi:hypothetical protein
LVSAAPKPKPAPPAIRLAPPTPPDEKLDDSYEDEPNPASRPTAPPSKSDEALNDDPSPYVLAPKTAPPETAGGDYKDKNRMLF